MRKTLPFIGRKPELDRLRQITQSRVASLIVLRGRRRIGKTRLMEEFGKKQGSTLLFTGLPSVSAQKQRDNFALQMSRNFQVPGSRSDDWNHLFWALAHYVSEGPKLIVFDEISWLGSGDVTFLGKLKTAWDTDFKKNPELTLVLTGSVSSWIEKNILNSTGFVGRISLDLVLDELPLSDCAKFWGIEQSRTSAFEMFKILAVTGGVPRYLEEIIPTLPAEENIKRLCFQSGGLLVEEYQRIFSDLFKGRSEVYDRIIKCLENGPYDRETLRKTLDMTKGGRLSDYLHDLVTAGFISEHPTWNIKTGTTSKLSQYRLKDNYLRFYTKYIAPNLAKIKQNRYQMNPRQWPVIFGYQFESLVLNNRDHILKLLQINPHEVVCDNPYFQRATTKKPGCQIDYLIQTSHNTLYLCEIKYSQTPVSSEVIRQVEGKISAINLRGFSVRTVLVHVNGVSAELYDYFSYIIDFAELVSSL